MGTDEVAIVGANGQLGRDLHDELDSNFTIHALTHEDIEVSSGASVRRCLDGLDPDFLINTAALHDVGVCEDEPERAFSVNGNGPRELARWCEPNDCKLVQISSDYVFGGEKREPYTESDRPAPVNVYGVTKLAGELFTTATSGYFLVVRTSGLFGIYPCRGKSAHNFVEMFLDLVDGRDRIEFGGDEVSSPTSTSNLAEQLRVLLEEDANGIYHAVSEGECSWYEFGQEILSQLDLDVRMEKRDEEYEPKITRPAYTALSNQKLEEKGLSRMNHWKENLATYLARRSELPTGR